jgi:hypothetical protein
MEKLEDNKDEDNVYEFQQDNASVHTSKLTILQ